MTEAFAPLPRRPGPAVPQRHAGAVLRALRSGAVPAGHAGAAGAGDARRAASIWRSACRNTTGGSSRRSGSRRPACFPLAVDTVARHQADRAAGARQAPRRRARQLPVRRPDRAEQEDRGPHPARRALQALRRRLLPLHLRRPLRRRAAVLCDDSRADVRVPAAERSLRLHRPGARRGARRLLPARGGLHLAQRARRLLRAARSKRWRPTCRSSPTRRRRCRKRSAAPASSSRRRISSTPPSSLGALAFDDDLRATVIAGQRRRLADFGDDTASDCASCQRSSSHPEAAIVADASMKIGFIVQRYGHRSARRLGAPLPAARRTAGRPARRRRAHDLRPRLRDLEERVPGRRRPDPRRHRAPVRERPDARLEAFNRLLGLDLQQPAQPRRRDGVAEAAGALVPGADRLPAAAPAAVRRADVLHVSLRADGARPRGEPGEERARPDRARRAGDQARDLQGRLQPAGRPLLPDRQRAAVRPGRVPRPAAARGGRRRRRRHPAAAAGSADAARRSTRTVVEPAKASAIDHAGGRGHRRHRGPRRTCWPAARCSAGGTGCTGRSCSTAAGSIPARAARS